MQAVAHAIDFSVRVSLYSDQNVWLVEESMQINWVYDSDLAPGVGKAVQQLVQRAPGVREGDKPGCVCCRLQGASVHK